MYFCSYFCIFCKLSPASLQPGYSTQGQLRVPAGSAASVLPADVILSLEGYQHTIIKKKMKSEMEAHSQAHYGHSLNKKVCESMRTQAVCALQGRHFKA